MGRRRKSKREQADQADLVPPGASPTPSTTEERTPPEDKPPLLPPSAASQKKPAGFATALLHLHPKTVPQEALKLDRTYGLGGMAVVLFLVLIITGALLLFVYQPAPERAYASILELEDQAPFGAFVRAIHHWAGNGLLVVAALHLMRVFYTGAFHAPRRFNWVLGLMLLALVVASNFTGYLLPWDQLAYWAVTIGTGMLEYVPLAGPSLMSAARGGGEVGARTLSTFFVLHIALLPILLFVLTAFHFWLVRKGSGVMLPRQPGQDAPRRTLVLTSPNLVVREGVAALVLLAVLLLVSALFPAPLQEQANSGMSPNPAKAPWYFMGVQELLVHLHPTFAVFAVPLLAMAFLLALPYFRYGEAPTGSWFHSERGRRTALVAAAAALVLTPSYVVLSEFVVKWPAMLPFLPQAVSNGLVPVTLWAGAVFGLYWVLRRFFSASRLEAVQAAFTFLAAASLVLTATGVFFRGEAMRLSWPW
jgi:quinol-cytochrome oxidoreductase complex cytochrome b subunit